jgi:hypothetical protein
MIVTPTQPEFSLSTTDTHKVRLITELLRWRRYSGNIKGNRPMTYCHTLMTAVSAISLLRVAHTRRATISNRIPRHLLVIAK